MRKLKKSMAGHFMRANVPPKKDIAEFKVSPEGFLPVGYMLGPRHFRVGQFVDVKSRSKGKGTAGTIKRWNFSSQENTHGNSKAHRLPGAIGQCEFPGRVFKGKKMAGKLGYQSTTMYSLRVVKIDLERSLLYLRGNVPGCISEVVRVRDAFRKIDKQIFGLDFPTFVGDSE